VSYDGIHSMCSAKELFRHAVRMLTFHAPTRFQVSLPSAFFLYIYTHIGYTRIIISLSGIWVSDEESVL